jgi:HAE1 family hydrophobic/amphiphilic exporter-1
MNLSEPFIRRPVMTVLVMVTILFLGVGAYLNLPISNMPDVNYPVIQVLTQYPGMNPELVADNIATPLEQQFMSIAGIRTITSSNIVGQSTIVLQFDLSKDMTEACTDVEAAISRAQPELPRDLPNNPTYTKVNPAATPVMYICLVSDDVSLGDLYNWGSVVIGQHLSMISGVAQVVTYGTAYAVRVQMDPDKLASTGITLDEVSTSLQDGNVNLPTGQVDGTTMAAVIYPDGQLTNAKAYEPLIVAYRDNAPVRIHDLGQAIDSVQNDRLHAYYVDKDNEKPTVVIAVLTQPNANDVEVANGIKELMPSLLKQIPDSIKVNTLFDMSLSIESSINDVKMTLLEAFVLVVLVIFLYLGKPRDTIIPTLALPMSIVFTLLCMYLLGYTLDNLSTLALTLAIGFIIDDAIVVLENIVRHVESGTSPWKSAIIGSQQISFTILSMTLSLVAVFIPLLFMGGVIGMMFREFSVVLATVTLASGFISLTLTPMLCSRFIPPHSKTESSKIAQFADNLNQRMVDMYAPKLKWMIAHSKIGISIAVLSVVCSALMFMILPQDFMPGDDMGFFMAYTQGEEGTSSDRMNEYQQRVNEVFQNDPNVANFVSVSGYPEYRQGIAFVSLKPRNERVSAVNTLEEIYPKLAKIPGVQTFLKNIPMINLDVGTQVRGSYQYALQSLDNSKLYPAAAALIDKLEHNPMFVGVNSDMEMATPTLSVKILRDKASSLGVTAKNIENAFNLGYSGNYVTRIQSSLNQYDVILELLRPLQRSIDTLNKMYVRSDVSGELVPLSAVASWSETLGPNSINHINQFPSVTLNFNIAPDVPLSKAMDELHRIVQETLPREVQGVLQGSAQSFETTMKSSAYLLFVAIFAIYIILGILYENFIHPITILSTLPPAILGGLVTLWIFNEPVSFYAYLGLILLIGIVKKNGIMMVDYALDNIREKGETAEQSIYEAALVRFRPIMMTTIAAIAGAIPIVIGSSAGAEARRPLGLVIIGGLLFSQLITLFITPTIYLYFERLNEKFHLKGELEE